MPLSLDKSGTILLFRTEEWLMWYCSFGRDVPGPRISLCVQVIYFSPVLRQPVTSLKLVAFTSKNVEQAKLHQASVKNLHCFV